ncbi:MAG: hypothetical protein PHO48_04815 [Candidatus Gracilibacteria bacterium]|nr:hypothetical protein [Candidatus Gracilibacteria bacterium]MDD5179370.1 hypothetical protein [Candidatus Gracilibacteria bacterium]
MPPAKTKKSIGKIKFEGDLVEYFIKTFLIAFLVMITFGLAAPYFIWWQVNFFIKNSWIEI